METRSTHVPVTGTERTTAERGVERAAERGRGAYREGKEAVGDVGEQVVGKVKELAHQACEACHNWRHYPKLLTTVVLLAAFLTGVATMGTIGKVGSIGKQGSWISSHWDRNTADAHHALDVILDHLQHPELYESSHQGRGIVQTSRTKLSNFLQGILPSGWGGRKSLGRDRGYMEQAGEYMRGREPGIGEKIRETVSDLGYRAQKMGERATDSGYGVAHDIKETGYGLTSKLGDMVDSVKSKFGGGGHMDDIMSPSQYRRGGKRSGGYDHDEEEDEVDAATEKLRRVVRQADREL